MYVYIYFVLHILSVFLIVQFVGVPLAVIQQVYVQLDLNCSGSGETELCHRSEYSKIRIAASYITSKMEDTIE